MRIRKAFPIRFHIQIIDREINMPRNKERLHLHASNLFQHQSEPSDADTARFFLFQNPRRQNHIRCFHMFSSGKLQVPKIPQQGAHGKNRISGLQKYAVVISKTFRPNRIGIHTMRFQAIKSTSGIHQRLAGIPICRKA